jgi:CRISPR/Cas system-associated exonuclease Cas4 (RecB family)
MGSRIGEIENLRSLEEIEPTERGNTDWLIRLLKISGRAEFALKFLNEILKKNVLLTADNIKIEDIDSKKEKRDHIKQIGINLPSSPDFIVPKYGIVGDIKTGTEFKSHFQLTCASYALAYENVKGRGNDISWGIIYFLPTRSPSWFVKPITFAQIYIFPIDDYLRQWFIVERDKAYSIISKKEPPEFPPENEREHCRYCKYKKYCQSQGLEVDK